MSGTAIKSMFDEALVRRIAAELHQAHRSFDTENFVLRSMDGLSELELTGRAMHIAEVMHECLPKPFAEAAAVIEASLGPELLPTGEIGRAALRYMPHVAFVQTYGLDDYEASIRVQAELTKRFTAEFSIRAFLIRYPEQTYAQMKMWAVDDNAHLRRLASEGIRPRLPWAPRLKAYQQDPGPVLELLELLKDDPVLYVRRSVANNLNDIAKDHPSSTIETCRRWAVGAPPSRAWLVRHALRSLIVAGNRDAISILGGSERASTSIRRVVITPQRVALGDVIRLSFEIESTAPEAQHLLVGYAVNYVKASGDTRAKVFRLGAYTMKPGEKIELKAKVSLAMMTTRRHYPGHHRVDAIINGEAHSLGSFEVIA